MHQDYVSRTGALFVADLRGVYQVLRCSWLVRMASGCTEPDSFADTFVDVECDAITRVVDGHRVCDAGHDRDAEWTDAMERAIDGDYGLNPATTLAHIG